MRLLIEKHTLDALNQHNGKCNVGALNHGFGPTCTLYAHQDEARSGGEIVLIGPDGGETGWHIQRGTRVHLHLKLSRGYHARKYERVYEIGRRLGKRLGRQILSGNGPLLRVATRRTLWFATAGCEKCFKNEVWHGLGSALRSDERLFQRHLNGRIGIMLEQSNLAIYIWSTDGMAHDKFKAVYGLMREAVKADDIAAKHMPASLRQDIEW
jgi:hypothetical protein